MPISDECNKELVLLEPDDFDETELTEPLRLIIPKTLLYKITLICIIVILYILFYIVVASSVTLNITEHMDGQGLITSSYVGDSLNIWITSNSSNLNILVLGEGA